jgi:hypothetical protein
MFGDFQDRRTDAERERDLEAANKREMDGKLARGFLDIRVRQALEAVGIQVGFVGRGFLGSNELLVKEDDITYKLVASVDNSD